MSVHRSDLDHAEIGGLGRVTMATPGGRVAARLIDTVAVAVPAALAAALVWPEDSLLASVAVVALVGLVYDTVLVATRGTTPGKKLLRLDIVDVETGTPPSLLASALRAVGAWVIPAAAALVAWLVLSAVFTGLIPQVGLLLVFLAVVVSPLFDEWRRRGVTDRLAGTVVMLQPQV